MLVADWKDFQRPAIYSPDAHEIRLITTLVVCSMQHDRRLGRRRLHSSKSEVHSTSIDGSLVSIIRLKYKPPSGGFSLSTIEWATCGGWHNSDVSPWAAPN